jgi:hypothetical protein
MSIPLECVQSVGAPKAHDEPNAAFDEDLGELANFDEI